MKSFALFALLGSVAAFSPAGSPQGSTSLDSTAVSAPYYAESATSTPAYPLAVPSGDGPSYPVVIPPGDLYAYDQEMTGSVMPDAQRQTKPNGIMDIRTQQDALGVWFVSENAAHSRGLSRK